MAKSKKYIFNPKTLTYEVQTESRYSRVLRHCAGVVIVASLVLLYFWLYTSVFHFELPKTTYLKRQNEAWATKLAIEERRIQSYENALEALQMRDEEIYRSIFGMVPIPAEVRDAGFGGVNRYAYLDGASVNAGLRRAIKKVDKLTKKSYVQSLSYDEIGSFAKKAGDMASSVPKISPINPDPEVYRLSSGFGVRTDPVYGGKAKHNGIDFAMRIGNPVYSTGDGVVEKVIYGKSGYGNNVIVDHGFGYKTRYAHLSAIFVEQGQKVKRGDFIAKTGNSGKSSGPHLHYEVIYMGSPVNPANYLDLDITPEDYSQMVRHAEAEAGIVIHPSHKNRNK